MGTGILCSSALRYTLFFNTSTIFTRFECLTLCLPLMQLPNMVLDQRLLGNYFGSDQQKQVT
jgi:hypothetical protein